MRKFKVILSYSVSLRSAWTIYYACLKKSEKQNKTNDPNRAGGNGLVVKSEC